MKVVFYSEQCEYSKKLLAYLEKNNIKNLFKLVNIDNTDVPDDIDVVPSIVDTELNQPMKGKKAFEYLLNLKYFNNPTNNVDFIKELPPNPNIPEDDKAVKSKILNLELGSTNTNTVSTETILNDLFTNISKNVSLVQETNESKKLHESNSNKSTEQAVQEMLAQRNIQDSKLALLMKMKRK
jgi:arsenate reductase-like glutaredoxin family protein